MISGLNLYRHIGFHDHGHHGVYLLGRISLRDRLLVKEMLNQESLTGLIPGESDCAPGCPCELAGAALLSIRFIPQMGWEEGFLPFSCRLRVWERRF